MKAERRYSLKGKKFIPSLFLKEKKFDKKQMIEQAIFYERSGGDGLLIWDQTKSQAEHEKALRAIKEVCRHTDFPVIGAGNVRKMEDVKKLLYGGCTIAAIDFLGEASLSLAKEVGEKFGKEKIALIIDNSLTEEKEKQVAKAYGSIFLLTDVKKLAPCLDMELLPILPLCEKGEDIEKILREKGIYGISGPCISSESFAFLEEKEKLREKGIPMDLLEGKLPFESLKKDSHGLIPVIAQDYQTNQVLMMAYMNQEAYEKTLKTGMMTYYSRSRQELWIKGLTSGHFQYVKSLWADCDKDTILAKVAPIGPACHTGKTSCFFEEIVVTDSKQRNPMTVLEEVYHIILQRKLHPKDGSYTNYLLEKGVDKILKKLGEEGTEIIIAAKNPDPEEIKYEVSDFLYHLMVLMVEKNVTWEDIMRELAER